MEVGVAGVAAMTEVEILPKLNNNLVVLTVRDGMGANHENGPKAFGGRR